MYKKIEEDDHHVAPSLKSITDFTHTHYSFLHLHIAIKNTLLQKKKKKILKNSIVFETIIHFKNYDFMSTKFINLHFNSLSNTINKC